MTDQDDLATAKALMTAMLTFTREAADAAREGHLPHWSDEDFQVMHDVHAEACIFVGIPLLCDHTTHG